MADSFDEQLRTLVGDGAVHAGAVMSDRTTFHIGGPAEWLVEPSSMREVADVVALCRACDVPWRILGCGSNLLVADAGVRGVVIAVGASLDAISVQGGDIIAEAGATNEAVARCALEHGLSGYEFASGIPGSVGGAAIMNAGAYGGEFSDVAASVTCLDTEGRIVEVSREQARWGYRTSMMMRCGYVVLAARIRLSPGDPAEISRVMEDLADRRSAKQPLELPSAGSTFKRPEGYFAGQLIDEAGMRGFRVGDAQVSEKHAGFVVNVGHATAADVIGVIEAVRERVHANSGVELEPEVRMWGFESR